MTTNKPVLTFAVPPELDGALSEFWHTHHFASRASACKWLLTYALKQKPTPSAKSVQAMEAWRTGRPKQGEQVR